MTSFQKRVYRSFALNFLTSDNEVVLFHSVSHLIYSIYQEFIWLNLWSTLVKVLMINKLFLKKKEFAKIFSRSRMKVRHKDYFIYSHGSWRIFHACGSCWPDFFSELAIALIIPYILYNASYCENMTNFRSYQWWTCISIRPMVCLHEFTCHFNTFISLLYCGFNFYV